MYNNNRVNQELFLKIYSHPDQPDNLTLALLRFASISISRNNRMFAFDGVSYIEVDSNPIDFFSLQGVDNLRNLFTNKLTDGNRWAVDLNRFCKFKEEMGNDQSNICIGRYL